MARIPFLGQSTWITMTPAVDNEAIAALPLVGALLSTGCALGLILLGPRLDPESLAHVVLLPILAVTLLLASTLWTEACVRLIDWSFLGQQIAALVRPATVWIVPPVVLVAVGWAARWLLSRRRAAAVGTHRLAVADYWRRQFGLWIEPVLQRWRSRR